jgi:hypothetical protein
VELFECNNRIIRWITGYNRNISKVFLNLSKKSQVLNSLKFMWLYPVIRPFCRVIPVISNLGSGYYAVIDICYKVNTDTFGQNIH